MPHHSRDRAATADEYPSPPRWRRHPRLPRHEQPHGQSTIAQHHPPAYSHALNSIDEDVRTVSLALAEVERVPVGKRIVQWDGAAVDPRTVCHSGTVMAPRARVDLVRSSRLASRAPCAYAAVAHDVSRLVFTADACPLDESAAIVAVGDVAGQAEQVMTNLRTALHAAGADLPDVVKTTVYVASQRREGDLLAAWEVVRRHFGDHDAPSTLR